MMKALQAIASTDPDPALYEVYIELVKFIEKIAVQESEEQYRDQLYGYAQALSAMCYKLETRYAAEAAITAEGLLIIELESLTSRMSALEAQLKALKNGEQPDPVLASRLERTRAAVLDKLSGDLTGAKV